MREGDEAGARELAQHMVNARYRDWNELQEGEANDVPPHLGTSYVVSSGVILPPAANQRESLEGFSVVHGSLFMRGMHSAVPGGVPPYAG